MFCSSEMQLNKNNILQVSYKCLSTMNTSIFVFQLLIPFVFNWIFVYGNISSFSTSMMISGWMSSILPVLKVNKKVTATRHKIIANIFLILFIIFATGLIRNIDREIAFQCFLNIISLYICFRVKSFILNRKMWYERQ